MSERLERILIVGRDVDAWITALALRRALGASVTVLELPSLLLESDVYAVVPAIRSLHQMLGLDDGKVVSLCNGVPMIAQRFSNWGRTAPAFLHPYDAGEPPGLDPPFLHFWLKGRSGGLRLAYEDFSLVAAAAKQGRIPASEPQPDAPYPLPGWQLDARSYAGLMKHLALKCGTEHRTGRTAAVERASDSITAVQWDDGERFEADLYVDASGAGAVLIRDMPGAEFESWREWLPCDQILSASGKALRPLPAFAQISAFRGGWIGLHPLQNRTAIVATLSSEHADEQMLHNLPILAGIAIDGDAVMTPFEAGLRRTPWAGNCVAVGTAAAQLEPLDSALIYFLHVAVSELIASLSGSGNLPAERDRYNRAIPKCAENIRDFQAAHYRLNRRFDEPLWDKARAASGPASVESRISEFKSRGTVPVEPDEPFQEGNWTSLFIGHGLVPQAHDLRVDQLPDEHSVARVQGRLRTIAKAVVQMPTVEQFLSLGSQSVSAPQERVS